jgi:hypothetical protein
LASPTGNPKFYNLPSIHTPITGTYEARLSITQIFALITQCNKDNVSTRQCELLCRQKFIHSKCTTCRSSTLNTQLLGVRMDTDLPECTIAEYTKCYRKGMQDNSQSDEQDESLTKCYNNCQPACSYLNYDLSYAETVSDVSFAKADVVLPETTLIAPVSDYVTFQQRSAYTWFKVVADCGGLM